MIVRQALQKTAGSPAGAIKKKTGVTIGLIKKKRPGYFRAGPDGLFVPAAARGRSFLYPSLCDSWINDFTPFAGWETPFGTAGCEPVPDADDPAAPGSFAPVFAALCSGVVVRISQLLSWFFLNAADMMIVSKVVKGRKSKKTLFLSFLCYFIPVTDNRRLVTIEVFLLPQGKDQSPGRLPGAPPALPSRSAGIYG